MKNNHQNLTKVIEAAGGVLWKETPSGSKIAIIHRERYNDWSLPKGKREPDEKWEETALREVWEETSCKATLGKFIGSVSYLIDNDTTPKVVLFWHMQTMDEYEFQPNQEVDRLKWVTPKIALKILSYAEECKIIKKAVAQLLSETR